VKFITACHDVNSFTKLEIKMYRTYNQTFFKTLHVQKLLESRSGVPNLGYMYTQGYICLSEGVHLRLSIEEQNIFAHDLFPNIYAYINEFSFQKSLYAYC